MGAPEGESGSTDETVLAGERTSSHPTPTGPSDPGDAPVARLFDAPLPQAADAVVPTPEQRDRYPARLLPGPPPAPPRPEAPIPPAPHLDGEFLARRAATNRRRQAVGVVAAAVAVSLLALAGLVLVLLT